MTVEGSQGCCRYLTEPVCGLAQPAPGRESWEGSIHCPSGDPVRCSHFEVCFLWAKRLFENKDTDVRLFGARYQPGLPYEQPKCCPEKESLGSCANAASKCESQVTMLQGPGLSLHILVSPSALPTQQSSSLVSFLVGFLGKSSALRPLGRAQDVCWWRRYDVGEDKRQKPCLRLCLPLPRALKSPPNGS